MLGAILAKEKEACYDDSDTLMERKITGKDINQLYFFLVVVVFDKRHSPFIFLS